MAVFKLSKWYLDCVSERGETAIVYTGSAEWGKVGLHYSSVLESLGTETAARHTLRKQAEPALDGKVVRWRSEPLGVAGEWVADAEAVRETVYACPEGSIEWECLMPRARAKVGTVTGLGYAERLTMTVAPWRLPIRTLRWGRFLSDSDWLVWIDWTGVENRRVVYWNGRAVAASSIGDQAVEIAEGGRLVMDRRVVLREGRLGATALSAIPGIKQTFPARLLGVHERKWRSRSRLERADGSFVEGWAIHEVVEWPE
jgi:hypothetical protein